MVTLRSVLCAVLLAFCASAENPGTNSVLVIVCDGLRPDYVTPDLMPNLHALGRGGVVCTNHHSAFPTVTRVNASAFSTGCYPSGHGILGNTIYVPQADAARPLSTGDAANLMRVDELSGGRLLTAPSLGELLDAAGLKLAVASAGSTGSAFLLNHRVKGVGVMNVDLVLPEPNAPHVRDLLGDKPEEGYPNAAVNRYAVESLLRVAIGEEKANAAILWLSDPDHTAHARDMGSPTTNEAIRLVDGEIGRIVTTLETMGLKDTFNVLVTSDHGFSTHVGPGNLAQLLVQAGHKKSLASTDVIVAEGAIYVDNHDADAIRAIVKTLQKTDWIGPVFTRAKSDGSVEGVVPGTLSFDSVYWDHERSGDIMTTANWTDEVNDYGYKGKTTQSGVAGHGTSSPFDIHNTLIAFGSDIKAGSTNNMPTGNIDIAPTVCHLLGVRPAEAMQGRVLHEIMNVGPDPSNGKWETSRHEVRTVADGVEYRLELQKSRVGMTEYVDFTKTTRRQR
jgi:predicted AlkP superfamily pyrophosphatase or phosphodiesterase